MANDVEITMSADSRAALKAFQNLNTLVDKLHDKINKSTTSSNKLQASVTSSGVAGGAFLSSMQSRVLGFAGGMLGVRAMASQMTESGRAFEENVVNAAKQWDQVWREFQGQSGLRGPMADLAENRIRSIAQELGVDVYESVKAATQLVSSGFSAAEASGSSLREYLKGVLGANVIGKSDFNSAEMARMVSTYLSSQNLEKTGENLRKVIMAVQQLYKTTNLQFSSFDEFSREAKNFYGKMPIEAQLATFSSLLDVMPSPQAAVGMRQFVLRLSGADKDPAKEEVKEKALRRLGLKASDVDFVGESFFDVAKRFRDALAKVKPEEQTSIVMRIFEERGSASALHIVQSLDEIAKRYGDLLGKSAASFESDVSHAMQGVNSATRRIENERQRLFKDNSGERDVLLRDEYLLEMQKRGFSQVIVDSKRLQFQAAKYLFGMDAAQAAPWVLPFKVGQEDPWGFNKDEMKGIKVRAKSRMEGLPESEMHKREAEAARYNPSSALMPVTPDYRDAIEARKRRFASVGGAPGEYRRLGWHESNYFSAVGELNAARSAVESALEDNRMTQEEVENPRGIRGRLEGAKRAIGKLPNELEQKSELMEALNSLITVILEMSKETRENTKATKEQTRQQPAIDNRTSYRPTSRLLNRGAS